MGRKEGKLSQTFRQCRDKPVENSSVVHQEKRLLGGLGIQCLGAYRQLCRAKVPEVLSLRRVVEQFLPPPSLSKIIFRATSRGNLVLCGST